ncbi:MAG: protein kinase [Bryobacteraceae bacterium]
MPRDAIECGYATDSNAVICINSQQGRMPDDFLDIHYTELGSSETHIPGANDPTVKTTARSGNPPSFAPGEVLANRYQIACFLGSGGMGEVYAATDTLLQTQVALKVIRPEIAYSERAALHFRQEIQLARKVTHPNVCRIFEVGTAGAVGSRPGAATECFLFLTMELVGGESLAEKLRSGRILATAEALQIFAQVAEGLAAAHRAGVIHGDLKPGNIMLAGTEHGVRAVITDFGLAVSTVSCPNSNHADHLQTRKIGTPGYMSPEQYQGIAVTPASDLYSLGIVIYVSVTGHLPVLSATSREAGKEQEKKIRRDVRSLPRNWANAILRCLATDPARRFRDATELLESVQPRRSDSRLLLRRLGPRWVSVVLYGSALVLLSIACFWIVSQARNHRNRYSLPNHKQIAVIPFEATDGDPRGAAFGRGLAETVTARLTKLTVTQPIQVVPAGEIRDEHVKTVQQARRDFGVNLGIEGSVRRYQMKMRVTYNLVDANSLTDLYSETLTVGDEDPFALEDQVSASIENALHLELSRDRESGTFRPTTRPVAYDFYLQGRGYLQDYARPQAVESAINVFARAIELDPGYGPAYAGLGEAYWYRYEETRDDSLVRKAQNSCRKAVQLQGSSPEGHICLGTVFIGTNDYSSAEAQFHQALDLDPINDEALRGVGAALAALGKPKQAEETYQRAVQLRPNFWVGYNMLGVFYFQVGRYADAETMFRQVVALSPDNYRGPSNIGGLYLLQGRYADAVLFLQRAVSLRPASDAYSNLGSAYFFLHRFIQAAEVYRTAISKSEFDYILWGNLAEATLRIPRSREESRHLYERAIDLAQQQLRTTPKDATLLGNLALYNATLGRKARALDYVERALAERGADPLVRFKAAEVFKRCGDVPRALHWLSAAVDAGYSRTFAQDTPSFEDLHADARFQRIFER